MFKFIMDYIKKSLILSLKNYTFGRPLNTALSLYKDAKTTKALLGKNYYQGLAGKWVDKWNLFTLYPKKVSGHYTKQKMNSFIGNNIDGYNFSSRLIKHLLKQNDKRMKRILKYEEGLEKAKERHQRFEDIFNRKEQREQIKREKERIILEKRMIREQERIARLQAKLFAQRRKQDKRLNEKLLRQEEERIIREIQEAQKSYQRNEALYMQTFIKMIKEENNQNLLKDEVEDYDYFYNNYLTKTEQKHLDREMYGSDRQKNINGHIKPNHKVFDSSWIEYAEFISLTNIRDYRYEALQYENLTLNENTRGLLRIKVKRPSKRNRTGKYVWFNVRYGTWKRIIADPTGTNFWKVFLKKNKNNLLFITNKSQYYQESKNKRLNKHLKSVLTY